MTTELQRVMARYEDARIAYKKAVLASFHGDARGESIRRAIGEFQRASADLRRITGAPQPAPIAPKPPKAPVVANGRQIVRKVPSANVGPGWVARALAAAGRVQLPSLGFALRRLIAD